MSAIESLTAGGDPVALLAVCPLLGVSLVTAGIALRCAVARRAARSDTNGEASRKAVADGSAAVAPPTVGARSPTEAADRLRETSADAPRRVPDTAVTALGATLARSRRSAEAEARAAHELNDIPRPHWLIERHVAIDGTRVPFVIAGPTGLFLLSAGDAWEVGILVDLARLGASLAATLGSYDGQVHVGHCLAFDPMEPRIWHAGAEQHGLGGWVLGVEWLNRWLYSFESSAGPDTGDLRAVEAAARPRGPRRAASRLPIVRNYG